MAQLFRQLGLAIVLVTPVIVMAAGQLAGGLAWLTISGEDAADLVATAPLPPSRVIRAKIEVVLIAIARHLRAAGRGACCLPRRCRRRSPRSASSIAAASATAIQLWFRVQARRSQFRRRQTSSRLATFAEAFSSIGWAATAALALAIPVAALVSGLMTAGHRRGDLEAQPARGSERRRRYALISSITAAAKASGSSCGRLWPARGMTRWVRRPVKLRRLRRAVGRGRDAVGVAIQRDRRHRDGRQRRQPALQMSAYCGSPSARPKRWR